MDGDQTLDCLFLSNTLHHVPRFQIEQYGVPSIFHAVMETLDLGKGGLQTVPLGGKTVTAGSDGQGVCERGIVAPEGKLWKRRPTGEEVQDGADDGALLLR